jgi:hypothetical protein
VQVKGAKPEVKEKDKIVEQVVEEVFTIENKPNLFAK